MESLILVAIIAIAIVVTFLVLLVFLLTKTSPSTTDPATLTTCSDQKQCPTGTVCDSGVCKGGIGFSCASVSDCSLGLICLSGVCQSSNLNLMKDPKNVVTPVRTMVKSLTDPTGPVGILVGIKVEKEHTPLLTNKHINLDYSTSPIHTSPRSPHNPCSPQHSPHGPHGPHGPEVRDEISHHNSIHYPPVRPIRGSSRTPSSSDSPPIAFGERVEMYSNDTEDYREDFTSSSGIVSPHSGMSTNTPEEQEIPTVVDACSYANSIIFLHIDGSISRDNGQRMPCNVTIQRLESFAGYLYGLSSGILYKLKNDSMKEKRWIWESCSWSPVGITHFSATSDTKNLWIQCDNKAYLYDNSLQFSKTTYSGKRVYGYDLKSYIDINGHVGIAQPGDRRFEDIHSAVITSHGEVAVLKREQLGELSAIRLVNWQPYYIAAV